MTPNTDYELWFKYEVKVGNELDIYNIFLSGTSIKNCKSYPLQKPYFMGIDDPNLKSRFIEVYFMDYLIKNQTDHKKDTFQHPFKDSRILAVFNHQIKQSIILQAT